MSCDIYRRGWNFLAKFGITVIHFSSCSLSLSTPSRLHPLLDEASSGHWHCIPAIEYNGGCTIPSILCVIPYKVFYYTHGSRHEGYNLKPDTPRYNSVPFSSVCCMSQNQNIGSQYDVRQKTSTAVVLENPSWNNGLGGHTDGQESPILVLIVCLVGRLLTRIWDIIMWRIELFRLFLTLLKLWSDLVINNYSNQGLNPPINVSLAISWLTVQNLIEWLQFFGVN